MRVTCKEENYKLQPEAIGYQSAYYALLEREIIYISKPLPIGKIGAKRFRDPGICEVGIFRNEIGSFGFKVQSFRRYGMKSNVPYNE